ncbi:GIY-YIG nuclease family protein [Phreatobacter stygius]|uniref:GIY-YIG nuclease family protein n=1 Tax=Phreatobacter stygius TaxID=1940610 RepID=A0A4D7B895_9HYPH|nr:GIY-YIG nuclease family protein [Phreatobacter stygius]QCI64332.1 GIY-YIG nuclease family protein [Phreatobacter stygius]
MRGQDRKAAIAAYKERKGVVGIYLVRCLATGEVWVGQSPNLDTVQNRIRFTLRFGSNTHRGLQKAWRDHGEEGLAFEIVETLADEESTYVRNAVLKERAAHWRSTLGAEAI